jgi:hypothetical protein
MRNLGKWTGGLPDEDISYRTILGILRQIIRSSWALTSTVISQVTFCCPDRNFIPAEVSPVCLSIHDFTQFRVLSAVIPNNKVSVLVFTNIWQCLERETPG